MTSIVSLNHDGKHIREGHVVRPCYVAEVCPIDRESCQHPSPILIPTTPNEEKGRSH